MEFKYGPNKEYRGYLSARLLMIGKDKITGERVKRTLKSDDYEINTSQYDDIMIVLRISGFKLENKEHHENSWLELPLKSYIATYAEGMELLSSTQVLVMGTSNIRGARRVGDIRFKIADDLTEAVKGRFSFDFDFISARFKERKNHFRPSLPYLITSDFPEQYNAYKEENTKAATPEIVEETPVAEEPVEEVIESEQALNTDPVPTEEIDEYEAATEEDYDAYDEVDESESYGYTTPSFLATAPTDEEERLFEKIDAASKSRRINNYCERYREKYPSGYYTEEVLIKQIEHAVTSQSKGELLEEYVELFPEGKYTEKVNQLIMDEFDDLYYGEEGTALEVGNFPYNAIQAEVAIDEGTLFVDHIRGGVPPYRLEFYDIYESNMKNYAIDIGKNRAFRVNLKALPLENNNYVIGIVDASGLTPFYSTPMKISGDSGGWLNFSFISIILGALILAILVLLFITNRISFFRARKGLRADARRY